VAVLALNDARQAWKRRPDTDCGAYAGPSAPPTRMCVRRSRVCDSCRQRTWCLCSTPSFCACRLCSTPSTPSAPDRRWLCS